MSESSTDPTQPDVQPETDQDAEPTLNAPGEEGPTGIVAEGEGAAGGGVDDADDQDSEPTKNAPAE